MNDLVESCAGAGKTTKLVKDALAESRKGGRVLLVSYTENNQNEIRSKLVEENGFVPSNIVIKGWYKFLIEDFVRPYRPIEFEKRIGGVIFNEHDPHVSDKKRIPGRAAIVAKKLNRKCFLGRSEDKVHTTYLSKLVYEICKRENGNPTQRVADVFCKIFIDEVQDLIGWDFHILERIVKHGAPPICCVGDFRQTIYSTATSRKMPYLAGDKVSFLDNLGFRRTQISKSRRSVQQVRDLSDLIFSTDGSYPPTESIVQYGAQQLGDHEGVFSVSESNAAAYFAKYRPIILRDSVLSAKKITSFGTAINFGKSKGCTFERTLIAPTEKILKFLSGDLGVFDNDKTGEARNNFYVAVTRARYSLGVVVKDPDEIKILPEWTP